MSAVPSCLHNVTIQSIAVASQGFGGGDYIARDSYMNRVLVILCRSHSVLNKFFYLFIFKFL